MNPSLFIFGVAVCLIQQTQGLFEGRSRYGYKTEFERILTPNKGPRTFYVTSRYDFSKQPFVVLDVMACNDAHINLMADVKRLTAHTYEIVIGGWRNTKSVIRTERSGLNRVEEVSSDPPFLDCNSYKRIWISFGVLTVWGRMIQVATETHCMKYYDSRFPYKVTGISVSTGYGATGKWKIYKPALRNIEMNLDTLEDAEFERISTPDTGLRTPYIPSKYDFSQQPFVVLYVKACSNAHINLMADVNQNIANTYEIVIGGWSNKKSVIRTEKQGPIMTSVEGRILDCGNYKRIWISFGGLFSGRMIQVATDTHCMSFFHAQNAYKVTGISVSTGYGSAGEWKIYKPIYEHPVM